jgi:hypothetical protein
MPRVVAFGCSCTYGEALSDCYNAVNGGAGPHPSKLAWPQLLANKLNYSCINLGEPALSNAGILFKLLNFKFESGDLCFIMWTYKTRDIVFQPNGEHKNLGRWTKEWLDNQDMYNMVIKNKLHMHHAQLYLESKGISFYSMDVDYYKWHPLDHIIPKWARNLKLENFNFEMLEKKFPLALDGVHFGEDCHKEIADKLYNKIVGETNA